VKKKKKKVTDDLIGKTSYRYKNFMTRGVQFPTPAEKRGKKWLLNPALVLNDPKFHLPWRAQLELYKSRPRGKFRFLCKGNDYEL